MRKAIIAGILVSAAAPAAVQAQACIGIPAGQGQFAVLGEVGFPDDAKTYSISGTANIAGPLSISATYAQTHLDNFDDKPRQFGGSVAYEMQATPRISACPVAGVTYGTFSTDILGNEIDFNQLLVPVGVGVGTTVATTAADFTVYAIPQFLWARNTVEGAAFGEDISDTENETGFGVNAGVRVGRGPLFGGVSVYRDNFEESETVFSAGIGFIIGR